MSTYLDDPRIVEFDVRTDEMLVNMGPQHPSTHGVLRLVLRTDGEIVSDVQPHLGYLHRCAEKIGENLTPRQWIPYTDRMDYLAAMNMNLGWSLVVEKMLKYELPEKARHLRVVIAEMGRIASHLVGMGAYGLDLGTFSPFLYAFREREKILDLFEEVCGARLTYSYITPGGVTADLPPGWLLPLMIPIELVSQLARPISLAVRLFANMTAGHTILGVLFGLAIGGGLLIGWLPFAFTIAMNGLEVGIAFIQAYIFTTLACVYLGDAFHLHGHDDHAH